MIAYGLPRNTDVSYPDLGAIYTYALPGGAGNLPGHGGDIHDFFRSPAQKARIRRAYKRRARQEGRRAAECDD